MADLIDLHCPFHDDGNRFSCHLSKYSGQYRARIPPGSGSRLDACRVLAGRTLVLLGDSITRQMYDTLRCHLCRERDRKRRCRPPELKRNRTLQQVLKAEHHEPACASFGVCGTVCYLESGTRRSHYSLNSSMALQSVLRGVATRPDTGCTDAGDTCPRHATSPLVGLGSGVAGATASQVLIVANDGLWYTEGENWAAASRGALRRAADYGAAWRRWTEARAAERGGGRSACLLWRETGPQHFGTRTGTFRRQGAQQSTGWIHTGKCAPHGAELGSPWEPLNAALESQHAIPVVRVWNQTRALWDMHLANRTPHLLWRNATGRELHSNFDCTHWCTPGVVDMWVALMMEALQRHCS